MNIVGGKQLVYLACALGGIGGLTASGGTVSRTKPTKTDADRSVAIDQHVSLGGTVTLEFDAEALARLGIGFATRGDLLETPESPSVATTRSLFELDAASSVAIVTRGGRLERLTDVELATCGAILVDRPGERVVIGNLTLQLSGDGRWFVADTLRPDGLSLPVFLLSDVWIELLAGGSELSVLGELTVTSEIAEAMNLPEAQGAAIGLLHAQVSLGGALNREASGECAADGAVAGDARIIASEGPDVIVADLQSTVRFERLGDVTAYGVGTTSCNVGTARADWVASTNKHPVIIQNLYRLNDFGFQQIGMSWVKHGFYAVSQSLCSPCLDPTTGSQLGVGCSDPYSAALNGVQSNMSPRSVVNGFTGQFPYPYPLPPPPNRIERRMLARDADLEPAMNVGARYFIEGHYVTADDAAAGNNDNNASYREVWVSNPSAGWFDLLVDSNWPTRRGQPAVRAWKDTDPTVVQTEVRVPGEGLMILAAKARAIGNGRWRYLYALQNLNSDRSARSFSVQLPAVAAVENVGFRDVDHHSGEPYATTNWTASVAGGFLTWSTQTYEQNANANALRYDVIFTFWFEANVEPAGSKINIGLFKPGFPTDVSAASIGPRLEITDCNGNTIPDLCDIDCNEFGCAAPCGQSSDCNGNHIPDECENDCDKNGIADECDIADCPPGDLGCADCNANLTPDRCEADCDADGIPDACDWPEDTDGDGVIDCVDLCPTSTPPGVCDCPDLGMCCFSTGFCIYDFPRLSCLELGGTPDCLEGPCRMGCLLGDADNDGDIDLHDLGAMQNCFSGENPGGPLPDECTIPFDFEEDGDIDLTDLAQFCNLAGGP